MDNSREIECFLYNIAYLRRQYGLSKQDMARKLGISRKTLKTIEAGTLPPRLRISIVHAIYRHFGIMPSTLVSQKLDLA